MQLLTAAVAIQPIMALALIHMLIERPHWFLEWVQEPYKAN